MPAGPRGETGAEVGLPRCLSRVLAALRGVTRGSAAPPFVRGRSLGALPVNRTV